MDRCKKGADNAARVSILFGLHKNSVSFAPTAALALDDLGVGHPAANGEEGGGGRSNNKKLQDKMQCDIWLAASSVDG